MTDKERIEDLRLAILKKCQQTNYSKTKKIFNESVDDLVGLLVNLTIRDNYLGCYTDDGEVISKGEYIGNYCDLGKRYD